MKKLKYAVYRIAYFFVKLFTPKFETIGLEHLPDEPCLIAANHCHMYGPIAGEIYFPGDKYIWCASPMMTLKEVPAYAFQDFWSMKPAWTHWFYKILSYLIAPLSVCIFGNAHTIPVYRDSRLITTFKQSMQRLNEGNHVIIFPEHPPIHNQIVCDFQEGFVDIAKTYYRQTGKALKFVPMYIAPKLHKMVLGEPIEFNPEANIRQERGRICEHLMAEITRVAVELPRHKVIPYNNVPKREYVYNKDEEA